MTGTWEGMTQTYFDPETVSDESVWRGTITPILNGMFVRHDYTGMLQDKPLSGSAFYGCQLATGTFQSVWLDSFHNGTTMMVSQGTPGDESFNVLGSYGTGEDSPPWGWRTVIEMPDIDTLNIRMYNISPEGVEYKAVITSYRRV